MKVLALSVAALTALAASSIRADGVYINSDAWNFWLDPKMGGYDETQLRKAIENDVDFYAVKGVRAVFYNMNFQRCFFPTKVGTPYWKDVTIGADGKVLLRGKPISYADGFEEGDQEAQYKTMFHGVTNMVKRFPSYMAYRYDYCHRKGIEMWHSFRVDDIHYATLGQEWRPQHNDLWLDHKECVRAWYRHTWRREWPDGTLDYGNRRVYDHQLGIVREYLMDYPSDGIEFDWLRASPVFKPGFDDHNRGILTQFLRDARKIADEAERKWGHGIRMAHRVPARVRDAYGLGLEIAVWAREGLVDVLMPGGCPGTATEQDCEVAIYRELAPKPVVLAPEIDCTVTAKPGWRISIDDAHYDGTCDAGFASAFYQQGADAIYFYNHFPRHGAKHAWVHDFFSQAADRQVVAKMPRRHAATYHQRCGESRTDESPFPFAIWKMSCNGGVNINCGEQVAGRAACVILGATIPLDVDVLVNTVPCGRAKAIETPAGCPFRKCAKTHYYTVSIPSGALHDGVNNVELFNRGDATITPDHLVWMDVSL